MTPLIGITGFDPVVDYVAAVQRAGGEPALIERSAAPPEAVLAGIDGLLLPGGADIDPTLYGAVPHPATKPVSAPRDRFEIELTRLALQADLPLLGICRGQQVMNVAAGGTLIQDIPSEVSQPLRHSVSTPLHAPAHDVWVSRNSRLWSVLHEQLGNGDTTQVNSRHHQAVGLVGAGLEVSALAPDGIIEGIERPGARFCLAVQWHLENFWRTGEFRELFETLVASCRREV